MTRRIGRCALLLAVAAIAVTALAHRPDASPATSGPHAQAVVLAAQTTTATTPTTPTTSPGELGPQPIQVGPPGSAPAPPPAGSGGTINGGSAPSPSIFDIPGQIEAAIDSWFRDLVTTAFRPEERRLGMREMPTRRRACRGLDVGADPRCPRGQLLDNAPNDTEPSRRCAGPSALKVNRRTAGGSKAAPSLI
jgi:hypothetical protein